MRIAPFARAAAGTAAAVIASSGLAFALTAAPADLPEQAQVPSEIGAERAEGTQGDEAAAAGLEEAAAHHEEAEANHAAARAFAERIREWTACIQDNAANAETPRGDDFDPKDGCEDVKPETTPSGQPFDPGADERSEAAEEGGEDAPDDAGAEGRATAEEHRGDAGPPEGAGPADR
jgi:hypothetical protein